MINERDVWGVAKMYIDQHGAEAPPNSNKMQLLVNSSLPCAVSTILPGVWN